MTTISHVPELMAPNRSAQVTFTLTQPGANYVRVWCTAAPVGSELRDKLDAVRDKGDDGEGNFINRAQELVYQAGGGVAFPWRTTFDKGGKYTFAAQEYVRGGDGGPAYQGDPNASDGETKIGTLSTLTLFAGQKVRQPIGTGQDRATLVLWIWDEHIRATSVAFHGELSPAIVNPSSDRARLAIASPPVIAALAALVPSTPITAEAAMGDVPALVSSFVSRWNAHVASATFHEEIDADNTIPTGLASASTPEAVKRFAGVALRSMRQHFSNDSGGGVDSADYHDVDGKLNDWANAPIVLSAASMAEGYGAVAELHRCYEGHRVSDVHDTPDSTALDALPPLLALHAAFLEQVATTAPSIPAAEQDGVFMLRTQGGFEEKPL